MKDLNSRQGISIFNQKTKRLKIIIQTMKTSIKRFLSLKLIRHLLNELEKPLVKILSLILASGIMLSSTKLEITHAFSQQ